MGPGVGGGGGWGGGTRGERAMSKPQGDRLREAATARCLKTGGRTTVPGRRVAGVAVISKLVASPADYPNSWREKAT